MIRPRWRKVFHDFWDNKARSFLVVASIFIGVYSVGLAIALYSVVGEDMNTTWEAINPNQAEIWTSGYQPEFLDSVRRVEGVDRAQGERTVNVRIKTRGGEWIPLTLYTRPDFSLDGLDQVQPRAGAWPPGDRQLVLESTSLPFVQAGIGDVVEIELGDETIRQIPVVGIAQDVRTQSTVLGVNGYVTYDTLEWLHESRQLNKIVITVRDDRLNKAHIEEVANRVADQARKSGLYVVIVLIPNPGEHPGTSSVLGVVAVIGALGSLSIFLAGFLIFNMLAALLNQHIPYIGIMKAIGARNRQIIGMYLTLILFFSLLALMPAILLAAYTATAVTVNMADQFNYISQGFRWVPAAVTVQVVLGLLAPLLAGMIPVFTGTRISVHRALSNYGLSNGGFGKGWIDRIVERIRFLSRPMLISLRNTFRRKGRLLLTLTTLILGGAIFIGVFNLRNSLVVFVEQFGKYFLSDVNLTLGQNYPVEKIEQYLVDIPGIERVEPWTGSGSELLKEDGTAEESVQILAPPVDSSLIEPILLEGRWIEPGDENAIVLNNAFWRLRPDLKVGDEIVLQLANKESTWKVVGFFQFPGDIQLIAYTSYEYLSRLVNEPNRAPLYRIVAENHSAATQKALSEQVEAALLARGIQVTEVQPGSLLIEANARVINIIIGFFLFSAVLVALVGAIGLTGTMSMNVFERTREIGVMRAIGASNRTVMWMVVVEGMFIGLISWALSAVVAIPISHFLYSLLSQSLFQSAGKVALTWDGTVIWLIAAILLSVVGSLLPARNAARLTVREILAYQ